MTIEISHYAKRSLQTKSLLQGLCLQAEANKCARLFMVDLL
jgi:hypothetical protein